MVKNKKNHIIHNENRDTQWVGNEKELTVSVSFM